MKPLEPVPLSVESFGPDRLVLPCTVPRDLHSGVSCCCCKGRTPRAGAPHPRGAVTPGYTSSTCNIKKVKYIFSHKTETAGGWKSPTELGYAPRAETVCAVPCRRVIQSGTTVRNAQAVSLSCSPGIRNPAARWRGDIMVSLRSKRK